MKSGGQPGNTNAGKNKVWSHAINKALEKRSGRKDRLDAMVDLAENLLKKCDESDISALKELGDRLEGKPAQVVTGLDGGPIFAAIERVIVERPAIDITPEVARLDDK